MSHVPEFPKPLVRLALAAEGWTAEVMVVADHDGEAAAHAAGYETLDHVPARPFAEFPKWVYHADGRRQVVHTQAEAETLEGFEDTMPEPEDIPAGVPSPVGAAAMTASRSSPTR